MHAIDFCQRNKIADRRVGEASFPFLDRRVMDIHPLSEFFQR